MAAFICTHNIIQMAIYLRKVLIFINIIEEIWLLTNVLSEISIRNKQKVHKNC
jgi:hypothetical protein